MKDENKIIHGLWIGKSLSRLELLTLYSFLQHGHSFHLWVYEALDTPLPKGVVLRNANEIIPWKDAFRKRENDPEFGIGKGSYGAPFSDIFRYKLLFEEGGWWVDMDVTCLKPLDFDGAYFFRVHPLLPMIGNVMKCPRGSSFMEVVYEEAKEYCTADTLDWLLPNKILNQKITAFGLEEYIFDSYSNRDWWPEVEPFLKKDLPFPEEWHFVHWMNEEWRSRKLKKDHVRWNSALGKLYREVGLYSGKDKLNHRLSGAYYNSKLHHWLG